MKDVATAVEDFLLAGVTTITYFIALYLDDDDLIGQLTRCILLSGWWQSIVVQLF